MSVVVFSGPTIGPDEVGQVLPGARCLPPVAQGDLYQAAGSGPELIAVIDGYYERVPAVWHKEILWAMANGVHVWGAASMGALRAAELDVFGMVGVGLVYQQFRDGILTDDDEVAITHTIEEGAYTANSEAMVNIRATLDAATAAGVLDVDSAQQLTAAAKTLFYPDRTWPRVCAEAQVTGLGTGQVVALREFIRTSAVDQKRTDALDLLTRARDALDAGLEPMEPGFAFESTYFWEEGVTSWARDDAGAADDPDEAVGTDLVLDELRLQGDDRFFRAMQGTLPRTLSLEAAGREAMRPEPAEVEQLIAGFRAAHGLGTPEAMAAWLRGAGLSAEGFADLMCDELLVNQVRGRYNHRVGRGVPDFLRGRGVYPALAARAQHKRDQLAERGLDRLGSEQAGVTVADLVRWHGEEIGSPSASVREHRGKLGFADDKAMIEALLREYQYRQIMNGQQEEK